MVSTVTHRLGATTGVSLLLTIIIAATAAAPSTAAGPAVTWTRQFGTAAHEGTQAIGVDAKGRSVVGGITGGAFPGQVYRGEVDAFVRRYRAGGAVLWTRQFGSPADDFLLDVAVRPNGRTYAVGMTDGTLPGQTAHGDYDAFVRAYQAGGKVAWTRQFGTAAGEQAMSVAVDRRGRIYVVGGTEGTLPGQPSHGGVDAFVRRYQPKGGVAWTRQFGSSHSELAAGVAVDRGGRIYVVGITDGSLAGHPNKGNLDAFVRKYRPNGSVVWTRQFGSAGDDRPLSVAIDRYGGVYVVGFTTATLPGQASKGGSDAFVRKYRANGSVAWTRQFGTTGSDEADGVAVDRRGQAYVVGGTSDALPGQTNKGSVDAFVRKYRPKGKVAWTRQFGTTDNDGAYAAVIDPAAHLLIAGSTFGTLPGQSNKGGSDAFVRKYR